MKWDNDGPIVGAKPSLHERIFKHFNPKRGLISFVFGLAAGPIYFLVAYDWKSDFHWGGVILVSLVVASIGGLWGLFSKKNIPL